MVHQKVSNGLELSHLHTIMSAFYVLLESKLQPMVLKDTQACKEMAWYRVRTMETFQIDVSSVKTAQGVLPHKISPSSLLKILKRQNNSK